MVEGSRGGTQPLRTALKCFHVLDAITELGAPVRVSELARAMGWSRAAVHQQLVTLVAAGWMEQDRDGAYRLTLKPARIGQVALQMTGLGERVLPAMERLMNELNEAVSLAVLEGSSAVIVQRVEPGRPLQVDLRAEARMPIGRSASGRVLLAYATEEQLAQLATSGIDLPAADELAKVRSDGFAVSTGQWLEGVTAVATPIFDINGRCAAALSVVGPDTRFDVDKVTGALLDRAGAVNRSLLGAQEGEDA